METIFNHLNGLILNKNILGIVSGVISFLITICLPYWWGKHREKVKKANEELPQILENYMNHIYNDLLKIRTNNMDEVGEFVGKYIKTGELYKISNPNLVNKFYRVDILINNTENDDYSEKIKQEVQELFSGIEDYYWFLVEEVHSSAYKIFAKYERDAFENMKSLTLRNIKVILDYITIFNIILLIFYVYYVILAAFKFVPSLQDKIYYLLALWYILFGILYTLVNNFVIVRYKSNLKAKRSISKTLRIANVINTYSSIYKELNDLTVEYNKIMETNKTLNNRSILLNESLNKLLIENKDSRKVQELLKTYKEGEEKLEEMNNEANEIFAKIQKEYDELVKTSKDIQNL